MSLEGSQRCGSPVTVTTIADADVKSSAEKNEGRGKSSVVPEV